MLKIVMVSGISVRIFGIFKKKYGYVPVKKDIITLLFRNRQFLNVHWTEISSGHFRQRYRSIISGAF